MILSLSIHRGELTNSSPSTLSLCDSPPSPKMSAKAAINKAVFTPHDEKMLAAVQVKRRTKKKIPFLATGGQGDYMTFICLSGTTTLIIQLFHLFVFPLFTSFPSFTSFSLVVLPFLSLQSCVPFLSSRLWVLGLLGLLCWWLLQTDRFPCSIVCGMWL